MGAYEDRLVNGRPRLPNSSYALNDLEHLGSYAPAPLDRVSYDNGMYKYDHALKNTMTQVEYDTVLDWMHLMFGPSLSTSIDWTMDHAEEMLDKRKASGNPWKTEWRSPTKGHVIEKVNREIVLERFRNEQSVFEPTLKPELRPHGKDARLFMPAPHECALMGNYLYGGMNEALMDHIFDHPITIGIDCPGGGMSYLWRNIRCHNGRYNDDDGVQFDARYAMIIAQLVRDFRTRYIWDKSRLEDHYRYYDQIYCARVLGMDGIEYIVWNQKSGQTNTATDNSFNTCAVYCLHAIRHGMSYEQFRKDVLFYTTGDDTVRSDRSQDYLFRPQTLSDTFNSLGMYIESPSLEPRNFFDLSYIATQPYELQDGSMLYRFRIGKVLSSFSYDRKKLAPTELLAKRIQLVILLTGHGDLEETCRRRVTQWYHDSLAQRVVFDHDIAAALLPFLYERLKCIRLFSRTQDARLAGVIFSPDMCDPGLLGLMEKYNLASVPHTQSSMQNGLLQRNRALNRAERRTAQAVRAILPLSARRPRNVAGRRSRIPNARNSIGRVRPGPNGTRRIRSRMGGRRMGGRSNGMGGNRDGFFVGSRTNQRTKRTITVTQDEYIAEINGSVGFVNTQYPINPGQSATFPWLSRQALQWEKYSFEDLEFYYKPEVSAFATNGQSGKVIFGADYDASDSAPLNKQAIEDTDPRVDCMPYQELRLKLSPKEMHNSFGMKFVRPGALQANADIKTYDAGNLNVATYGNTNTNLIGELRVRYRVKLEVPVLEPVQNLSEVINGVTPTTAANFGGTQTIAPGSSPIISPSGNVITFLVAGNFVVNLLTSATTATQTVAPAVAGGGVIYGTVAGGSGSANMVQFITLTVIPGTTLTFNNTIVTGTISELFVSSANTGQQG